MSSRPRFRPGHRRVPSALRSEIRSALLVSSLLLLLTACKSELCYSSSDCPDGSTCCDGTCTGQTPIPIGPAICQEGCQCESFMDDGLERSMCFFYEGTLTTQCTRVCGSDGDCVASDGTAGRCLELGEAALLNRLCVWETP